MKHNAILAQTAQQMNKAQLLLSPGFKLFPPHSKEGRKIVGEYWIDMTKMIGSGYSSKVYKCVRMVTEQACAMKIINFKQFSASRLALLENQIKILSSLTHANLLHCYNVYKHGHFCYIATELCQEDLQSYLKGHPQLDESEVCIIGKEIAEGMKYLMSQGILHRDLKPANILRKGKKWKIADFGFSMLEEGSVKTRDKVGTPMYMSPEVLLENHYSAQSDIFAFGVILYEMVSGRVPWQSKNEQELVTKLTTEQLSFGGSSTISPYLKALISQLCFPQLISRTTKSQFRLLHIEKVESRAIENKYKDIDSNEENKRSIANNLDKVSHRIAQSSPKGQYAKYEKNKENRSTMKDEKKSIGTQHLEYPTNDEAEIRLSQRISIIAGSIFESELPTTEKQKLALILRKHASKIINLLAQKNTYCPFLGPTKLPSSLQAASNTIAQLQSKIQDQYLHAIQHVSVQVLCDINKEFYELASTRPLTTNFYTKMLSYISRLVQKYRQASPKPNKAIGLLSRYQKIIKLCHQKVGLNSNLRSSTNQQMNYEPKDFARTDSKGKAWLNSPPLKNKAEGRLGTKAQNK